MSKETAKAILAAMKPHRLDEESPHPVTANHFCLTDSQLQKLGIAEDDLADMPGYDGPETTFQGRVHVFERDKLEEYAGEGLNALVFKEIKLRMAR